MVERVITNAKRVYVAGDDDQAIYRWAGARPEFLMNMEGTRTILNRSKRLLKLKESQIETGNIDLTISSFKPPIFWKEKDVVKKQIESWSEDEVKKIIYIPYNYHYVYIHENI